MNTAVTNATRMFSNVVWLNTVTFGCLIAKGSKEVRMEGKRNREPTLGAGSV